MIFESLDAFRRHCGEPSRPLDQCPICREIPEHSSESSIDIEKLEDFIEADVRRCPICHRLYFYESMSLGNDIYTGNDSTWSLHRYEVDVLFDRTWCVRQRLPGRDVAWVSPERFFPNHALVNFGFDDWGALDRNNRLVMLDGRAAIETVIDRDPPRPTGDLELAKRYALFVDEREYPDAGRHSRWDFIPWKDSLTLAEQNQHDDAKAASGLAKGLAPGRVVEMPCDATREGDNVIVRSWVMWKKRLILRIITVQPDGRYVREDAVIAENLPVR